MKGFLIAAAISACVAAGGVWAAGRFWAAEMDRGGQQFMKDLTRCDNCNTPILPGAR